MQKYRVLSVIGSGAYSQVFKAIQLSTGKTVAIKEMQLSKTNTALNKIMMRQAKVLRQLGSHPNIIKMIECFKHKSSLCLVLECFPMDLITFYKSIRQKEKRSLTDTEITCIFRQICSAIAFMHSNNLMHRDLKPENVLIDPRTLNVKIIDFGFAKFWENQNNTNYLVTRWYRPLEIVLGLPYDHKVDVFSLGAMLLQLYNDREVFRSTSNIDQIYQIINVCGYPAWTPAIEKMKALGVVIPNSVGKLAKLTHGLSEDTKDLIEKMLTIIPYKRLSIFEVVEHPYFKILPTKSASSSSTISTPKENSPSQFQDYKKIIQKYSFSNCRSTKDISVSKIMNKWKRSDERVQTDVSNNPQDYRVNEFQRDYRVNEFQRDYQGFHQRGEGRKKINSGQKLKRNESFSQGIYIASTRLKNHHYINYVSSYQNPIRNSSQEICQRKSLRYGKKFETKNYGNALSQSHSSFNFKSKTLNSLNTNLHSIEKSIRTHQQSSQPKGKSHYEKRYPFQNLRKTIIDCQKSKHVKAINNSEQKAHDRGVKMFAKIKKIVNSNYKPINHVESRKIISDLGMSSTFESNANIRTPFLINRSIC